MTTRQKYNLEFIKQRLSDGDSYLFVNSTLSQNPYSNLAFIRRLDPEEIDSILAEINLIENNQLFDPYFLITDGSEGTALRYENSKIIVDDVMEITITDFKNLLKEWYDFKLANEN